MYLWYYVSEASNMSNKSLNKTIIMVTFSLFGLAELNGDVYVQLISQNIN